MEGEILHEFNQSVHDELFKNIVPFWIERTPDHEFGGFYGRISNALIVEKQAPKSLILTTRILWTFARLYEFRPDNIYLNLAEHAYRFLMDKFIDREYGGAYWMVDYKGNILTDKKKMYGQAFTIYALAKYYLVTKDPVVLEEAKKIFQLIETHNYDPKHRGYFETSNRDWTMAEEMRLSEIDMNEMKSMNTHLHLMEAYAAFYRVWPDEMLKQKLYELIACFRDFIIAPETMHFKLFFDEAWHSKSSAVSFGHDIEGSWLLCETAEVLKDHILMDEIKTISLDLVNATMKDGFSKCYSIFSERNSDGIICRESHWWQQAEAVVAFINGYQLSKNKLYLEWAVKCWEYIKKHFVDQEYGEWFYETDEHGHPDQRRYKVSEWKGPYHNGRACMEVIDRLKMLNNCTKR